MINISSLSKSQVSFEILIGSYLEMLIYYNTFITFWYIDNHLIFVG